MRVDIVLHILYSFRENVLFLSVASGFFFFGISIGRLKEYRPHYEKDVSDLRLQMNSCWSKYIILIENISIKLSSKGKLSATNVCFIFIKTVRVL